MRFVIAISFILSGCLGINHTRKLSKEIKSGFTNRFEGNNTGLSQKINTAGYYRYWLKDEFGRPEKIPVTGYKDTSLIDMIFYEDGTFVWNLWPAYGFNTYNEYFKTVLNKGKDHLFYKSHSWGIYSISGDTIKAQYMMHAAPMTPWYTGEEWFLIKNPTTLQVIYHGDFDKPERDKTYADYIKQKHIDYVKRAMPVNFIPLEHIPPPLPWLKKRKVFLEKQSGLGTIYENVGNVKM